MMSYNKYYIILVINFNYKEDKSKEDESKVINI